MEVKKQNDKYQYYYKDICIGVQQLRQTGGCTVITVPKKIVEELHLDKLDKALIVLLIRQRKVADEVSDDEVLLKVSKREAIIFQEWLKRRENGLKSLS